jgi:hypothetical protein
MHTTSSIADWANAHHATSTPADRDELITMLKQVINADPEATASAAYAFTHGQVQRQQFTEAVAGRVADRIIEKIQWLSPTPPCNYALVQTLICGAASDTAEEAHARAAARN